MYRYNTFWGDKIISLKTQTLSRLRKSPLTKGMTSRTFSPAYSDQVLNNHAMVQRRNRPEIKLD